MNRFSSEHLKQYFNAWDNRQEEIGRLFEKGDTKASEMLKESMEAYKEILEYGGVEMNAQTGEEEFTLQPLNGAERLEFIQAQLNSRYAYVQLGALYEETRKKAARLSVIMNKN